MIIGLIPARSGSKGVKNKNIKLLGGHPLLAWSIVASQMTELIDQTIVSTDSMEYAGIAADYGASILMRPPELAQDSSLDIGYARHALEEVPKAKFFVILRPTTPLREPFEINFAIRCFKRFAAEATSLRSSDEMQEPIEKCYRVHWEHTYYSPINDVLKFAGEEENRPRQEFLPCYHPNGYVDIVKASVIRKGGLYGDRILAHTMFYAPEIDREEDFDYIEWRLEKYGSPLQKYLKNFRKV